MNRIGVQEENGGFVAIVNALCLVPCRCRRRHLHDLWLSDPAHAKHVQDRAIGPYFCGREDQWRWAILSWWFSLTIR